MIEAAKLVVDNFGTLGALIVAAALILFLVNKMRNGGKVDNVQGTLYQQLHEQLTQARQEIAQCRVEMEAVYKERNQLREDMASIRVRIEHLEECRELVDTLKRKLAEKDVLIAERDTENKLLMREILSLKDRIHHLELRLSQDEKDFCQGCARGGT